MSQRQDESLGRRAVLRDTGRWLALGGIAVLSGGLIARSIGVSGTGSCGRGFSCGDCCRQGRCDLPQARRTQQELPG